MQIRQPEDEATALMEHQLQYADQQKVFYQPVTDQQKAQYLNVAHIQHNDFYDKCRYLANCLEGIVASDEDVTNIKAALDDTQTKLTVELAGLLLGCSPEKEETFEAYQVQLRGILKPV